MRKKIEDIAAKISVNLKKKKFEKENKKYTDSLVELLEFFNTKYLNLFKFGVFRSPFTINEVVKTLSLTDRKEIWKSVIAGEILNGIHIKRFVQRNLKAMFLNPNTTLQEYY